MPRTAITFPRRKTVENLVYNGDFEYAPPFTAATNTTQRFIDGTASGSVNNYSPYIWGFTKGNTATAQFDSSVSKFGTNSMKITTGSSAAYGEVNLYGPFVPATTKNTLIPALPNTTYTISWWMKTEYVSGDASQGATVGLIEYNGVPSSTTFNSNAAATIKTTTDWTFYSYTITTQSTTRFFNVQPRIYGHTGTATLQMNAWFDDITLVKSPVQTRRSFNDNILPNGFVDKLPSSIVAQSTGGTFMDGTAAGSATNTAYNWFIYTYSGTWSAIFDTSTKYSGQAALKLSTNAGAIGVSMNAFTASDITWSRNNIPCDPNTTYKVSLKIKTELISGSATTGVSAFISPRSIDNSSLSADVTIVTGIVTTTDWTEYTAYITTGQNARFLNPAFRIVGNNGAATLNMNAWMDEFSITPLIIARKTPDNLLPNGNFEYAPPFTAATNVNQCWIDGTTGTSASPRTWGWCFKKDAPAGSGQFDNSVSKNGTYSLKLSILATGGGSRAESFRSTSALTAEGYIPVLPNTSYTFTGWIKTNRISGDGIGAFIRFNEFTGTSTSVSVTNTSSFINTTQDWTQVTKTFTTASTTRFVAPLCAIAGTGSTADLIMDAWFDDITLTKSPPQTRTVVT